MTKIRVYHQQSRIEDQHPDVYPGSPVAILSVFTEIVRSRFQGDNAKGIPYYWSEDPTPKPDEDGTLEHPRKIIIESEYIEYPDARDAHPAIFVERGAIQFNEIVVGNLANYDRPSDSGLYIAHGTIPISVLCVANTRGVSATIADIVGFYLLANRPLIRAAFSFQDMRLPIIEATQVYRRSPNSIEEWVTPISTQVTVPYMWSEQPIAPLINEIVFRFQANNNANTLLVGSHKLK